MKRLGALLALILGLTSLGVVTATPAVADPPTNDDIAAAQVIDPSAATPVTLDADTTDATLEPDEADAAHSDCDSIDHSVWFTYTAPSNDVLRLDTASAVPDLDTVVSVYLADDPDAPTVDSLIQVRCNDQVGNGDLSSVQLRMTQDTTYFIQLSTYAGTEPGPVQLTLAKGPPPANDDRASAQAIVPGTPVNPDTGFATVQAGELASCGTVYSSVWYRWFPDATVVADLETAELVAGMDTQISVYRGSTLVACGGKDLQFRTAPGQTYNIQVADHGTQLKHGRPGEREIMLTTGPAPANDTVAGATTVTSPSTTAIVNTFAGVASESQPTIAPCNNGFTVTRTVWYRYSPAADGDLLLETLDPEQADTKLAVYTGPANGATFADLTPLSCDDDSGPGALSKLTVPAQAGQTYYVQVGTIGTKGSFDLHLASGTSTDLTATATGQTVALEATVGAISGSPTGTVRFTENGVPKGTAPVAGGTAKLILSSVAAGPHTYEAAYVPADTDFLASTSAPRSVTATAPPPPPAPTATTTTLIAPVKVFVGRRATIRVLVTTATGETAHGTVTITIGKRTKTVSLVNGRASLKSSRLRQTGKVPVLASYAATSTTQASSDSAKIKVRQRHRPGARTPAV